MSPARAAPHAARKMNKTAKKSLYRKDKISFGIADFASFKMFIYSARPALYFRNLQHMQGVTGENTAISSGL
jgi:hypothetical protein